MQVLTGRMLDMRSHQSSAVDMSGTWHRVYLNKQGGCDSDAPAGVMCVVAGGRTKWAEWGNCSVSCENGLRYRKRECEHPPPLRGGKNCSGVDTQTKPCTMIMCPVNGEWNAWSSWEQCNEPCGGGHQRRSRSRVQPLYDGDACPGSDFELQPCNGRAADTVGRWTR